MFLCCESILIFPILLVLEIIVKVVYGIVMLLRFVLEEVVVLIFSFPFIEIIDYIVLKLTVVDGLYCKNEENASNIHLSIKRQSFFIICN